MQGFRGFQLKQDADVGPNGDNTAANGLNLFCAPNNTVYSADNSGPRGNWSEPVFCPNETVICGIRVQIEPKQGIGVDDTSLNNVDFKCCHPFKNQVKIIKQFYHF